MFAREPGQGSYWSAPPHNRWTNLAESCHWVWLTDCFRNWFGFQGSIVPPSPDSREPAGNSFAGWLWNISRKLIHLTDLYRFQEFSNDFTFSHFFKETLTVATMCSCFFWRFSWLFRNESSDPENRTRREFATSFMGNDLPLLPGWLQLGRHFSLSGIWKKVVRTSEK